MRAHIGIAAALLASVVTAAGAAAQEPVTVDEAVRTAVAHNASLRAARGRVDEAAARADVARSGFFPRVSISESWQRGNQPVFVFSSLLSARRFGADNFAIDALNHPEPIGFFHTSVGIEQILFDGGRQRSTATAASMHASVADASLREAEAAVVVATTETFGRLIAAQGDRQAADAALAAANEDLARAERRRDVGVASDADVLAMAVDVASLRHRSIDAATRAGIARAELNRLMGSRIDREVSAAAPPAGPDEFAGSPDLSALLAEADAARPELRRAAALERAARAEQQGARAALIPRIVAQGALDVAGTRFADRASSWIVGAEAQWTFSTGGAERAAIRAAHAAAAASRAETDEVRAAAHVEVAAAVHRLESARAREAVGRAALDQAREAQRIVRDRFDAGIAGVNDVLRASTAVLTAESNRTSALVDRMVATAALRRALGRTP